MVVIDPDNIELNLDLNLYKNNIIISNNNLLKSCLKEKNNIKKSINSFNSNENKELLSETIEEENILHVVTVISNVCNFKRRWQLMNEFIDRMNEYDNIKLYIVELAYENQSFHITNPNNPRHLQLRTKYALWHKENMINLGINKLLPNNWKYVAWIDGDIEFENYNWVNDTLKVLTKFDIVQLFTIAFDLDENNIPMNIWQSYGYKYCNGETFKHNKGINYWHCGYAWACTREFYKRIGKIYDRGIVGSGDYILTQSILGNIACADKSLIEFKEEINNYTQILKNNIKVGYIPNNIKHYFHGSKINRKYIERNNILIKYKYNPSFHIKYDENGIIVPSENMSIDFINEIKDYFFERNDDEYYDLIKK
jgi:hypothetical protein